MNETDFLEFRFILYKGARCINFIGFVVKLPGLDEILNKKSLSCQELYDYKI